jgi:uncharacterized protein with ParB-like and HNH nuclease domain
MIKSVNNYPISQLFDIESNIVYNIPRYQREYTWGKWEWENLFDDILENENGYFLGSIICINQAPPLSIQLEVVDGQQRITTLSLLFAAIYSCLKLHKDSLTEDRRTDLLNLKRKLILKRDEDQIRVVPQVQNHNKEDYLSVLNEARVVKFLNAPPNAGNRRIFKAYRYFQERVNTLAGQPKGKVAAVMEFRDRVNQATMVMIEVESHSDAYILFESLNNRGVPLTAIDLIKNKLLSKLEQITPGHIDQHFNNWNYLLNYLGDDYTVQERFFRQYYNAFNNEFKPIIKDVQNISVATRSNLIRIYEKLIMNDACSFFEKILQASKYYSFILGRTKDEQYTTLSKPLQDLERIQGAPSYIFLLFVLLEKESFLLEEIHLRKLIQLFVRFFVRRNLTDTPPTRDLTRLFMQLINKIDGLKDDQVVKVVQQELVAVSADDQEFRRGLKGPIYSENLSVTRFILCALEENTRTRENRVDLWAMDGKKFIWTIEHIFPQGENIPQPWVDMIAGGDRNRASELQAKYVDCLGNLTISGYNSNLGNKSFKEKRDRKDKQRRYVGYKNGLYLNEDIAKAEKWDIENINSRTTKLVEETLNLFALEEKK